MRKIVIALGLVFLVSLFAAVACAASPAEGKKKKEAGVYAGTVAEIDLKTNRMVVALDNSDLAMVFNTSRATAGTGYKDLAEVKVGDRVELKFEAQVGIIYALSISRRNMEAEQTIPADKLQPPPLSPAK